MNARDYSVLVVEDNLGDLLLTRKILAASKLNILVSHARNGGDALRALTEAAVDLIVLDLNLPGVSGFDVLEARQANRTWRSIPVLVLSTSRSKHDEQAAIRLGADDFCSKPRTGRDYAGLRSCVERLMTRNAAPGFASG